MEDKLKLCKSNAHGNNHRRNKSPKKPYWNETLSCKWNTACANEKTFKKCKTISEKRQAKQHFIDSRREFDKLHRKVRRQYQRHKQIELENMRKHTSSTRDF